MLPKRFDDRPKREGHMINSIDWTEAAKGIGSVRQWTPLYLNYNADFIAKARAGGDAIAWYNCGPPPRITTGATASELRAYIWQAAKADLDFVAWWGIQNWNYYSHESLWLDRYAHNNSVVYPEHPDKPRWLKPGKSWVDTAPLDSVRWELIRDGMEDARAVTLLRRRIAEFCGSVFVNLRFDWLASTAHVVGQECKEDGQGRKHEASTLLHRDSGAVGGARRGGARRGGVAGFRRRGNRPAGEQPGATAGGEPAGQHAGRDGLALQADRLRDGRCALLPHGSGASGGAALGRHADRHHSGRHARCRRPVRAAFRGDHGRRPRDRAAPEHRGRLPVDPHRDPAPRPCRHRNPAGAGKSCGDAALPGDVAGGPRSRPAAGHATAPFHGCLERAGWRRKGGGRDGCRTRCPHRRRGGGRRWLATGRARPVGRGDRPGDLGGCRCRDAVPAPDRRARARPPRARTRCRGLSRPGAERGDPRPDRRTRFRLQGHRRARPAGELFRGYLERRGLLARVIVKVADEPPGFNYWWDHLASDARAARLPVSTAFNSIDWKQAERALGTSMATFKPLYMRFDPDFARRAQAAGHKVGWYNCGPPPTHNTGASPAELRSYYWQAARYSLDFVSRYGVQRWGTEGTTPETVWTRRYSHHHSVLYPEHPESPAYRIEGRGWVDQAPVESIRLNLIRDGVDDAEYVRKLRRLIEQARAAGRTAAADAAQGDLDDIWRETYPSLSHYNPPYEELLARREQVAQAILALKALLAEPASDAGKKQGG